PPPRPRGLRVAEGEGHPGPGLPPPAAGGTGDGTRPDDGDPHCTLSFLEHRCHDRGVSFAGAFNGRPIPLTRAGDRKAWESDGADSLTAQPRRLRPRARCPRAAPPARAVGECIIRPL